MDTSMSWTGDRVETLKKLWSDGLSASQIAAELGGVTRNAVIGKVHRLGMSGRVKGAAPPPARPRRVETGRDAPSPAPTPFPVQGNTALAAQPAAAPRPRLATSDSVVVPLSERVTIMDLREQMCRWPMGDPTSAEFRFCGARAGSAGPYCSHHATLAYQPMLDRRRDRRVAIG